MTTRHAKPRLRGAVRPARRHVLALAGFAAAPALAAALTLAAPDDAAPPAAAPLGALTQAAGQGAAPRPRPDAPHERLLTAAAVTVDTPDFYSWALLDRRTGAITGSPNLAEAASVTASMVKSWIAADHLRRRGDTASASRLHELSIMIRDSDNRAAQRIYRLDGATAVIERMISICGLTETVPVRGWWSRTAISARDAARLGLCLADGRAAGPRWTGWLLDEMRQVRGAGRFGIIEALPERVAPLTSIKNGWTLTDGRWHVACLAILPDSTLAVLARYPARLGYPHGAGICRAVTEQLLALH